MPGFLKKKKNNDKIAVKYDRQESIVFNQSISIMHVNYKMWFCFKELSVFSEEFVIISLPQKLIVCEMTECKVLPHEL